MTYENEMKTNRGSNISDDIKFTHWIIVGAISLAIVIAVAGLHKYGELPGRTPNNHDGYCPYSVVLNDWPRCGTPALVNRQIVRVSQHRCHRCVSGGA